MRYLAVLVSFVVLVSGCSLSRVVKDQDLILKYRGVLSSAPVDGEVKSARVFKSKGETSIKAKGDSYTVELKGVLVGDFVDMVFSKVLSMPYVLDQSVKISSRGIDISIKKRLSKSQLYQVAVKALERVGYWVELDNGVVFVYNRDDADKKLGRVVYSVLLSNVASYEIIDSLKSHISGDDDVRVSGDDRRMVVVSGEYYAAKRLAEIAGMLDREQKRIRVDVEIYEMNVTGALKIGFDGLVNASLGNIALNFLSPVFDVASLYTASVSYTDKFKSLVSLMKKDDVLRSVARPFLYCTDSKVCSFDVGQKIPILQSSKTSNEGSSTVNQLIYYETGVKVSISPVVLSGKDIMIDLTVETSKGAPNNLSSLQSPVIINRMLKSEIRAISGVPLVIAGILYDQNESILSGVPFESKWLNYIKTRSSDELKTELVMVMTPYIVDDSDIDEVNKKMLEVFKGLSS